MPARKAPTVPPYPALDLMIARLFSDFRRDRMQISLSAVANPGSSGGWLNQPTRPDEDAVTTESQSTQPAAECKHGMAKWSVSRLIPWSMVPYPGKAIGVRI